MRMSQALSNRLPPDWAGILRPELDADWAGELETFLDRERRDARVFPPREDVFRAFHETPFASVRVLILGQDPYHGDGQAHGLAFSVPPGIRLPPSLRNIFLERQNDLGLPLPDHGCLLAWARQGVFLLNTVLTVRAHEANSHRHQGWEQLTDAVVRHLSRRPEPLVFVLWGGAARKKQALVDESRHAVLVSPHPSPLSARRGFFGSRPFSAINRHLQRWGYPAIDWRLPPRNPSLPLFS